MSTTIDKPYAGYLRVSRLGDRDPDSLKSPTWQRESIESYAKRIGITVEFLPAEIDESGGKMTRGSSFAQVIAGVEGDDYAGVVVAKLDRLSRLKPSERVRLLDSIEGAGGEIHSAAEGTAKDPDSRFTFEIFFALARREWEHHRNNWQKARRGAIKSDEAKWIGHSLPFGYRKAAGQLVVYEPEAAVIRECYRLTLKYGMDRAVQEWNKLTGWDHSGKRTRRVLRSEGGVEGGQRAGELRERLANRAYLGEQTHRVAEDNGDPIEVHNPHNHEPLIDAHTLKLATRYEAAKYQAPEDYPLSGVLRCSSCGGVLVGNGAGKDRKGRDKARLMCSNYIQTATRGKSATTHCEQASSIQQDKLHEFLLTVFYKRYPEGLTISTADELAPLREARDEADAGLQATIALEGKMPAAAFTAAKDAADAALADAERSLALAEVSHEKRTTVIPGAPFGITAEDMLPEGQQLRDIVRSVFVKDSIVVGPAKNVGGKWGGPETRVTYELRGAEPDVA